MKKCILISIIFLLYSCQWFSDSRSSVTFNIDASFKHQPENLYLFFGSEKDNQPTLAAGESFSTLLFPTGNSHLVFYFNMAEKRYDWASWESDLFGKTFADKYFKKHNRYQIIIDLKPDATFFIKVYLKQGLFQKKLVAQGREKMAVSDNESD